MRSSIHAIAGVKYRFTQLDAMTAFKLGLKVLPLVRGMATGDPAALIAMSTPGPGAAAQQEKADEVKARAISAVLDGIASLDEATVDMIAGTALKVVERELPGGAGYSPVWISGQMMFDDITLPVLLQLIGRVLMDNLLSFMPASPQNFPGAATQKG